jgi:hypothetical protein
VKADALNPAQFSECLPSPTPHTVQTSHRQMFIPSNQTNKPIGAAPFRRNRKTSQMFFAKQKQLYSSAIEIRRACYNVFARALLIGMCSGFERAGSAIHHLSTLPPGKAEVPAFEGEALHPFSAFVFRKADLQPFLWRILFLRGSPFTLGPVCTRGCGSGRWLIGDL